ncbi:MAG: RNA polymerase sigma factor [Actinomycetota bacterium]|nr:RNA polymerase sigma factor [Actinomycetota bacterium]
MAEVADVVAQAHRREWARVLGATVRVTRDLDLAEECAQDAYATALTVWPRDGIPDRPGAWLTTVAANRARDVLRRQSAWRRTLPRLVTDEHEPGPEHHLGLVEHGAIDDDRLRLVFVCCHPALSGDAQVALTLRLVCGLTTDEVAHAFLVQPATMAARITRAKKKIAAARVPFRVPEPADLGERVEAVLDVVHLVFTTGHTAPSGENLTRTALVGRALDLGRLLHGLLPDDDRVTGLLALMLLVDARRATRVGQDGTLVLLPDQDRTRWDRAMVDEGVALLTGTGRRSAPDRFTVQAAIAAVHAEAATWVDTDWAEIVALYDVLRALWPSPVVELNRAAALGFRDGPQAGLDAMQPLQREPALVAYGYLSAARADLLRRLGRRSEAVQAYEEAVALTDNDVERAFLVGRLAEVRGGVADA